AANHAERQIFLALQPPDQVEPLDVLLVVIGQVAAGLGGPGQKAFAQVEVVGFAAHPGALNQLGDAHQRPGTMVATGAPRYRLGRSLTPPGSLSGHSHPSTDYRLRRRSTLLASLLRRSWIWLKRSCSFSTTSGGARSTKSELSRRALTCARSFSAFFSSLSSRACS